MVAYLKKIEGSEGFYQIVDFLNASHIRYALTENLTIYVSLIQQFWQTATASILDNEEMEITATIDGKVKIVTEASIRRHLKLEDSDGISNLPTTEIFKQLALMGVDIPLFPTMLVQGLIFQGERSTVPETKVPQPNSPPHTNVADEAASTRVDVRHGGAATTVTSLDARQCSGNIDKTPSIPYDSPLPRVNTLGSDEGRMQHNELMDLVTKLSDRVIALETYLQQTNKIYGTAFTKLIKKIWRILLNRRGRIVEINQDPDISLVQHDVEVQGRYEHDMESDFEFTAAEEVYTAEKGVTTTKLVSTVGASVSTASASSAKDKGKAIIEEAETIQTKTRLQQEQERLSYEAALRLQEQLDEEERQRIARVHEVASSFNIEECEDIQARIKADKELAQRLQAEEREKYSEAEKARLLAELIN
ncbi:hypothetical protein Tco_1447978 [Tanacetum coccineum]